ncbi:FAD-binding oxidoreductase [Aspergillus stella-maris]|uniref:FAD-binding oxidoreductase n=1 Tax=Aspergillus stella-maris TaxID=1810926 RepID=UPI003CCD385B
MYLLSTLLGLCAPLTTATSSITSQFSQHEWDSNTVFSLPGTEAFTNATRRWDILRAPTYGAALTVGSEDDLVEAVRIATAANISILATGGRHGYGGTLGMMQGGLALDLSELDNLVIDTEAQTLTVGPGIRFSDIFGPVYEAGFEVPTGTCSCVGMIGATLGAGIGRIQGSHGLILDALLSARVVTAAGEVLTVSSDSNEDIFWAIRGAGQNFGIVTEATYQLSPLTEVFTSIDLIFPATANISFFNAFADFDISPEWALGAQMFFDTEVNETSIAVTAVYQGSQSEALSLLAPILDLGPKVRNVTESTWNRLSGIATFGSDDVICEPGNELDVHAVNIRRRDAESFIRVFEMMDRFYADVPDGRGSGIAIEGWGNAAVLAVPDDETAYPWRDTEVYVMAQMTWTNGNNTAQALSSAMGQQVRRTLAAASGYDDLAVYVNYARGDETLEQRYGERKLPRLAELKRRYDPSNVFRYHHALPTAYP